MEQKELDSLMKTILSEDKATKFDYSGYGTVENLGMSNADLKAAVNIMWDLVMEMNQEERSEILFKNGLLNSKDAFLKQKSNFATMETQKAVEFTKKEKIFREKLLKLKPLVDVLVKLKNTL